MSNLNEIIDYIKNKIDYPIEKYNNDEQLYNVVKNGLGVSFENELPYSYISNISYKKRIHLGLYVLERNITNDSHSFSSRYNIIVRSKSRRYNDISSYEYWKKNMDKVIELAKEHLIKYKDEYLPEELPIEYGGVESNSTPVNHISLQHECSLCLFRLGMPSSFPANLMTYMLIDLKNREFYPNKRTLKILDISAGWGDRLSSACLMNDIYLACDPNSEMKSSYDKIIDTYGDSNKQCVYTCPFEDLKENEVNMKYNCLYTSPPFFNLEIYNDEPTQSTSRYKEKNDWLNNFLKKCLIKCDNLLEDKSYIYLHLCDIKHPDNNFEYVETIIDFCVKQLKWKYIGVYGHAMKDKEDKESETKETRNIKNKNLLKPTKFVKKYFKGLRINNKNEVLVQSIWHFIK